VRKKDELHRLFDQVFTAIGPVDILVNAAGLGIFAQSWISRMKILKR
jgi:short-subunit dehydrogenase